jgi:hypothetical protein
MIITGLNAVASACMAQSWLTLDPLREFFALPSAHGNLESNYLALSSSAGH